MSTYDGNEHLCAPRNREDFEERAAILEYDAGCQREAACRAGNGEAERQRNIYSRTCASGAGEKKKKQVNTMPNFKNGGPGRARTSNQTVMSRRL